MKVKTQLFSAFAALAALVAIMAGMACYQLNALSTKFGNFETGLYLRSKLVADVQVDVEQRAVAARNLVLADTEAGRRDAAEAVAKAHAGVQAHLTRLEDETRNGPDSSDEARALVGAIRAVENKYGPVALEITRLAQTGHRDDAIQMINRDCIPLLHALDKAVQAYNAFVSTRSAAAVESAQAYATTAMWIAVAAGLFAFAAAGVLGIAIARSVLGALGAEPSSLAAIATRIAAGDFREQDAFRIAPSGSVLSSMRQICQGLGVLIGRVGDVAQSVSAGSSQIASGNVDLSSRTEEQASALEEVASSVEELTTTVQQNAANAREAATLAVNASDVAEQGSDEVDNMVQTMGKISAGSVRINEITALIEGIAFQTNILALNAAVEAARAGEQGRGFAVVASEVRTLAQRSSSAAKEIKGLIESSLEHVREGDVAVGRAGQTMRSVTTAVANVTRLIEDIASASAEQSQGIAQIHTAVSEMDQMTQRNAALVEEAAAASQALEEQGCLLAESVKHFQVA
ncbi:methyl-accepting chemotaxis protein [Ralstonia wenshanensis]|uniref:methyl-accepting chemotaxis protein n=1 Tax=Ralstonia wenshanensis TaxID=2842456 RepID=UPI0039C7576B